MMFSKSRPVAGSVKGFTLIELLVVIAVIALLMAIIIPVLSKAREMAKATICRSNLRNIGMIVLMYLQDNDYVMPNSDKTNGFFWRDTAGNIRRTNDSDAYWGVAYKNYIKETKIFGCPSFRRIAELIYSVDPVLVHEAAYGLNENASNKKTTDIQKQAQFILTHDHCEPKMEQGSADMFHNDGPGTMNLTHYRQGGRRASFYPGIFRHNTRINKPFETGGRANILWLDWHVSYLRETTGDNVPEWWYTGLQQ